MAEGKRCVTDAGYVQAAQEQGEAIVQEATIDVAIQTALALWQRNSSKTIASMQDRIAKAQMKMAEDVQDHAEKFWDKETSLVEEVFDIPKYEANPLATGVLWGGVGNNQMRLARASWIKNMTTDSCLGVTVCMDARWRRESARSVADIMSFAARQEDAREEILNDRRYSQQYAAIALGRNLIAQGMAYQNLAGAAGGTAAGILEQSVNAGLGLLGFLTTGPSASDWAWGQGIQTTWDNNRIPEPAHIQAVGSTQVSRQERVGSTLSINFTERPSFEKDMATEDVDRIRAEQKSYDARWGDMSLGRI